MPVCGSNNVTYPNPFVLKCAKLRGAVSPGMSAVCKAVFLRVFTQNFLDHWSPLSQVKLFWLQTTIRVLLVVFIVTDDQTYM
jgi:hypothetical protein